jgi:hypothetical protein
MPEPAEPGTNSPVRYERRDFSLRAVSIVAAATAGIIVVVLASLALAYRHYAAREASLKESALPLAASERARLAQLPSQDRYHELFRGQPPLEGLMSSESGSIAASSLMEQQRRLDSYGWVDQAKGVVHVPLEQAARLALSNRERYLKARPKEDRNGKAAGRPWWQPPPRGVQP